MPVSYKGFIHQGQWFSAVNMPLMGGVRYEITVQPEDSNVDLDLIIQSPFGMNLAIDDSPNADGILLFTPPESHVYPITIASKNGNTNYTVTITEK